VSQFRTIAAVIGIVIMSALVFLATRSNYEEAVDCMLADTRWEHSYMHWLNDESGIVVFAYGRTQDQILEETYIIPFDGSEVIRLDDINIAATNDAYDIAMRPGRGWNAERTRQIIARSTETTRQLFVVDYVSGNVRQVTSSDYDVGRAHWSPDETLIAYAADRSQLDASGDINQTWGVMVIDDAGDDDPQLLTVVAGNLPDISWTPDGNYVLYSGSEGRTYRADVATGETDFLLDGRFPVWSPSGDRMVYLSNEGCNPDLFLADADGDNSQRIYEFTHAS
jgi:hypothetical protein